MELAILAGAVVLGGLGLVMWLNLTRSWEEADELRRFRDAMSKPLPDGEDN